MTDMKSNEFETGNFKHPVLQQNINLSEAEMQQQIETAVENALDKLEKEGAATPAVVDKAEEKDSGNTFFNTVASWYDCQKQSETIQTLLHWKNQIKRNWDTIVVGTLLTSAGITLISGTGALICMAYDKHLEKQEEAKKPIAHIAAQEQVYVHLHGREIPLVTRVQRDVWQKYLDGMTIVDAIDNTMIEFKQSRSSDFNSWTTEEQQAHAWLGASSLELHKKTKSQAQVIHALYYKLLDFNAEPYSLGSQNVSAPSKDEVRTR